MPEYCSLLRQIFVYRFLLNDVEKKQFLLIKKKTLWPLVRERTIPTERPPLVDEI
jgi:hypothetical protein